MALDIDISTPFLDSNQQASLVRAVQSAMREDESDWLEWKGQLDLSSALDQFKVAKQILGFANRWPDDAARSVGGHGYLIVGAEPGSLRGIIPIDPAKLAAALQRYLGRTGPAWTPNLIQVDNIFVLVIDVGPPNDGDPIFTLSKTFQGLDHERGADLGTIFVRNGARTEPAHPDDIRMLQRRLLAAPDRTPTGKEISLLAAQAAASALGIGRSTGHPGKGVIHGALGMAVS